MEEFQVHHANGGRYVERDILRCVVGVDPVLLHGHLDMDVVLRGGHEVAAGRQKRTSCVLSCPGLGASRCSHHVRAGYSVYSGCKLSQPDVAIQRDIAYSSELLRHVCAANSGHDRESHSVCCINAGPRNGSFAQYGSNDREGTEVDTNNQIKVRSHQSGLLRMLDAQSN